MPTTCHQERPLEGKRHERGHRKDRVWLGRTGNVSLQTLWRYLEMCAKGLEARMWCFLAPRVQTLLPVSYSQNRTGCELNWLCVCGSHFPL